MSTKTEQYATLERFFNDCVRFWAHELSEDPDLSKEPHKHALAEIPSETDRSDCVNPAIL